MRISQCQTARSPRGAALRGARPRGPISTPPAPRVGGGTRPRPGQSPAHRWGGRRRLVGSKVQTKLDVRARGGKGGGSSGLGMGGRRRKSRRARCPERTRLHPGGQNPSPVTRQVKGAGTAPRKAPPPPPRPAQARAGGGAAPQASGCNSRC